MPAWYFIVILSAIGGQGKSLFTELVALILRSRGCKIEVFSADVAERLADKLAASPRSTPICSTHPTIRLLCCGHFHPCLTPSIRR